jgi:hypothetical protein
MEIIHHATDFNGFRESYAIVVPRDSSTGLVPEVFFCHTTFTLGIAYVYPGRHLPFQRRHSDTQSDWWIVIDQSEYLIWSHHFKLAAVVRDFH